MAQSRAVKGVEIAREMRVTVPSDLTFLGMVTMRWAIAGCGFFFRERLGR